MNSLHQDPPGILMGLYDSVCSLRIPFPEVEVDRGILRLSDQ